MVELSSSDDKQSVDSVGDGTMHPVASLWNAWKILGKKKRNSFVFEAYQENFQDLVVSMGVGEASYELTSSE